MARKLPGQLSPMERQAIARIRQLRATHVDGSTAGGLAERAAVMHDLLRGCHGNVKLRLEVISAALGCTMRTLERAFIAQYSETMNSFHERMRLEYAEMQLTYNPDVKLTAVAAELGYDRESEFNRFFRRKKGETATQFARRMRDRLKDKGNPGD
jgi:AraC-like DNA-binding protein